MELKQKKILKKSISSLYFIDQSSDNVIKKTGLIIISNHYNKFKSNNGDNLNYYQKKLLIHGTTYYLFPNKNKNSNDKYESHDGYPVVDKFIPYNKIEKELNKLLGKEIVKDYTPIYIDLERRVSFYIVLLDNTNLHLLDKNKLKLGNYVKHITLNTFLLNDYKNSGSVYKAILQNKLKNKLKNNLELDCKNYKKLILNTNKYLNKMLGTLPSTDDLVPIPKYVIFDRLCMLVDSNIELNTYL